MANVGTIDRIFRVVIGGVLIAAAIGMELPVFEIELYKYGAMAVGLILIATSAIQFCPIYRIFGIRTCKA